MATDPFEEFRKKKLEVKKNTAQSDKYYDMPTEGTGSKVEGLVTHRFTPYDVEVSPPVGFEPTELGNALKDPRPEVKRPKGFESTVDPEDNS